jgi:hypothetical protein
MHHTQSMSGQPVFKHILNISVCPQIKWSDAPILIFFSLLPAETHFFYDLKCQGQRGRTDIFLRYIRNIMYD